jgi:hypothetical protein
MINKHESPAGKGSRENFSNGFASMTVATIDLLKQMYQICRCTSTSKASGNLRVRKFAVEVDPLYSQSTRAQRLRRNSPVVVVVLTVPRIAAIRGQIQGLLQLKG